MTGCGQRSTPHALRWLAVTQTSRRNAPRCAPNEHVASCVRDGGSTEPCKACQMPRLAGSADRRCALERPLLLPMVHSLPSHDPNRRPCTRMQPGSIRLPLYFCRALGELGPPAIVSHPSALHFTRAFQVYTFGVNESKRNQRCPANCHSQLVVNCALGHVARNLLLHTCTTAGG